MDRYNYVERSAVCEHLVESDESRKHCLFTFLFLCHFMARISDDIAAAEQQRSYLLACQILKRAVIIGGKRCRLSRSRTCQSCLRDCIYTQAQHFRLHKLKRDVSMIRRDVVRAGLNGSRRSAMDFHFLKNILLRHG